MIKYNFLKPLEIIKPIRKKLIQYIPIRRNTAQADTFVKNSDNIVPPRLQKLLDAYGPYDVHKKEALTELYSVGSEKFEFIYNHKYFSGLPLFSIKEFVKTVKNMTPKEIQQTFDEISDLYTKLPPKYNYNAATKELMPIPRIPNANNLAQLTILKAHNKEAYEYILNHPNKKMTAHLLSTFSSRLNGSVFETLTIPQIRQIEGKGRLSTLNLQTDAKLNLDGQRCLGDYVTSSDAIVNNADDVKTLHDYLSKFKVTEAFTAYRAEKDTGMFSTVLLDKKLALKTKWIVLKNILKARKIQVHDYTGTYDTLFTTKKMDLFRFIFSKKNLTLADAMQVVKFGNESYKNKILELIKKSQIEDTRFKSLTFDSQMAKDWLPSQGSRNTGILHNITVNKGAEGTYSSCDNRQAEFILNNNPKQISFQNVKYDSQSDTFFVDSTIG